MASVSSSILSKKDWGSFELEETLGSVLRKPLERMKSDIQFVRTIKNFDDEKFIQKVINICLEYFTSTQFFTAKELLNYFKINSSLIIPTETEFKITDLTLPIKFLADYPEDEVQTKIFNVINQSLTLIGKACTSITSSEDIRYFYLSYKSCSFYSNSSIILSVERTKQTVIKMSNLFQLMVHYDILTIELNQSDQQFVLLGNFPKTDNIERIKAAIKPYIPKGYEFTMHSSKGFSNVQYEKPAFESRALVIEGNKNVNFCLKKQPAKKSSGVRSRVLLADHINRFGLGFF